MQDKEKDHSITTPGAPFTCNTVDQSPLELCDAVVLKEVAKDEAGRRPPKGLDYKSLPSYRMTLASTPLLTSKSQAEHCDVHIHDIS